MVKALGVPAAENGALPAETFSAPMSFAQARLWILNRIEPESVAYNFTTAYRLAGPLDVAALQKSIDAIVARHESLRTTFDAVGDTPMQIVARTLDVPVVLVDLRALPEAEREKRLRDVSLEETLHRFDLRAGPLVRVVLARLHERDHVLLLNMHHVVTDAWSIGVFNRELGLAYDAYAAGREPDFEELPIQYADFALWQSGELQGDVLERQLGYWKEHLAGAPPLLQLPTDRLRPAVQSHRGACASRLLPPDLAAGLHALGRSRGATLFMTLLAAFDTLLYRYTGQSDIVVGSPIAGRNRGELETLIGFFVNTLVLRSTIRGDARFSDVLQNVRDVALRAYEHQDVPFERLVEELQPKRSPSYPPLINVLFVVQNAPDLPPVFSSLTSRTFELERPTAKVDLTLHVVDAPDGLECTIEYNTDLFDGDTIRRMLQHYETLLRAVAANPEQRVRDLPLLSAEERRQILVDWNDTKTDYRAGATVHELFEEQVARTPEGVAIAGDGFELSYRELNERANRLARELVTLGLRVGESVGVCVERSPAMVVGALAVLKAGGAYVPLDPEYPGERLSYMLADAGVRIVLTEHRLAARLATYRSSIDAIEIDSPRTAGHDSDDLPNRSTADGLAYVMYTSGSTGKPKGVLVPHRAVNRLVVNANYVSIDGTDVVGQVSNFAFDAATFELWGALLHGARLEIVPRDVLLSPEDFVLRLRTRRISVMFLTAALFRHVVRYEPSAFATMRCLIAGGEALDPPSVEAVLRAGPPRALLNGYGPTEATTFACTYRIAQPRATGIPIGRPISNTEAFILDGDRNPVPIGVAGQLYLGGPGLARGYLNDAKLTAEKFIAHPFDEDPHARLYATGDVARYLAGGAIEYLGRVDRQVKIRGFRIEAGEIEAALRRHEGVRDAAVVVREDDGDKRLVAYVVDDARPVRTSERWRRLLADVLPNYMLPSEVVTLPEFGLTSNGKIDVAALPAQRPAERATSEPRLTNPVHYQLIELWEDVLGARPIGIHDDFFELGGHSLLVTRLMSNVAKAFDTTVPISAFIENPTVEGLGALLLERRDPAAVPLLVRLKDDGTEPPFFFLHGDLNGGGYYTRKLADNFTAERPFYVLSPHGTDGRPVPRTIEDMARDYLATIEAVRPHGPYALGGYCSGGLVAFEMARQLQAKNEAVSAVILMDCSGANGRFAGLVEFFSRLSTLSRVPASWRSAFRNRVGDAVGWLRRSADRLENVLATSKTGGYRSLARRVFKKAFRPSEAGGETPSLEAIWRRVTATYIPRRYLGGVTLLVPSGEAAEHAGASLDGWRAVTGNLTVRTIPGNHLTCITRFARDTAAALSDCVDEPTPSASGSAQP